MQERSPDSRAVPRWSVEIQALKPGETRDLMWGFRYHVLSGEGVAEHGYKINDNVTQWKGEKYPIDTRRRDITPSNSTVVVRITAKTLLGIIKAPFEKLDKPAA